MTRHATSSICAQKSKPARGAHKFKKSRKKKNFITMARTKQTQRKRSFLPQTIYERKQQRVDEVTPELEEEPATELGFRTESEPENETAPDSQEWVALAHASSAICPIPFLIDLSDEVVSPVVINLSKSSSGLPRMYVVMDLTGSDSEEESYIIFN